MSGRDSIRDNRPHISPWDFFCVCGDVEGEHDATGSCAFCECDHFEPDYALTNDVLDREADDFGD